MPESWGWAGSVHEFLDAPLERWEASLSEHLTRLLDRYPSGTQRQAWREEHAVVSDALRACIAVEPVARDWGIAFEYELPYEGGRRPDVVVLAGGTVVVLEFKGGASGTAGSLDQVRAYARDLSEYHRESHGRAFVPVLVLCGASGDASVHPDGLVVTGPSGLSRYLDDAASDGSIDLETWLDSPYEPLPMLVAAAKRIFRHEPLPHVRRALALGIPDAIEHLVTVCQANERDGGRALAFVTGVPGAGKTLVGLRLVYEGSTLEGRAVFLSGNGPLVDVLQDALQSTVFVRDLHKFILEYGKRGRTPREHIIVFDEAQRAWDIDQVEAKHAVRNSEPDLLVQAGDRVPEWAVLVGLIGSGQEIHTGEEAGIDQWSAAITEPNTAHEWDIHCGPSIAPTFDGHKVIVNPLLDLNTSLRARRAEDLHEWVRLLLDGALADANAVAQRVHAASFDLYITRELEDAKEYARALYEGQHDERYGLVASSRAGVLPKFGVDNDFRSVQRVRVGPWFNAPPSDERSCCALRQPVTEFKCQGLELSLPIVCWGEDLRWEAAERTWWKKPRRASSRNRVRDSDQLLLNSYRVLLTRGRDGVVVWVPPDPRLDDTYLALLTAGVRPLPEPVVLAAAGAVSGTG
jgi:schlafen family protein